MLHLYAAEGLGDLAAGLASVLAEVPADPMEPEWIAVPTDGTGRWLSLELARRLGASAPSAGDGVAANITFRYPGALRAEVLAAGRRDAASASAAGQHRGADDDPWAPDRVAWSVLAVLGDITTGVLEEVARNGFGGSAVGRARHIADLFDRYHLRRPHMVRAWAEGRDLDGANRRLSAHHRWQPELWRQVRAEVGVPSPPEMLPGLLTRLRTDDLAVALPNRVVIFGVSVLPGGVGFVDLAEALAVGRQVHVFLLDPAPNATDRLRPSAMDSTGGELFPPLRTRANDQTVDVVRHPLLRSWGRLSREMAVLVGDAERQGRFPSLRRIDRSETEAGGGAAIGAAAGAGPTLLARIQADLRADQRPNGSFSLDAADDSVQFHTAHGPVRQVEVLRDALLHLLADDPTLTEDDIVVISPDLARFAPLVQIGLGPSAAAERRAAPVATSAPPGAPTLRYRLADRSIRRPNPVTEAVVALLDAAGGRNDAITVLDLAAQPAVRRRFQLDDDDLGRLTTWVAETNIRWGLDIRHRSTLGLPAAVTSNTWEAGLDQLLLGTAVAGDGETFAVGGVVPFGLDGDGARLAGRLADLVARLRTMARAGEEPRPVAGWVDLVTDIALGAVAPVAGDEEETDRLVRTLGELVDQTTTTARGALIPVTFADFRKLLDDRLASARGRPEFFRGGITITSPDSLRAVPHRVVGLLGLDQSALSLGTVDGDDLGALAPVLGDPDDRAGGRQALLDAVLAAGDHLVVVRNGHDLRTNQAVPEPVAVAELLELIRSTVRPEDRDAIVEVHHPRQAFDERNFAIGGLGSRPGEGPWSFDDAALAGARARRQRIPTDAPFLAAPLPEPDRPVGPLVIDLADLHEAVTKPIKAFLDRRLEMRLPADSDVPATRLPVEVTGLDEWRIGERILALLRRGEDVEHAAALERSTGGLPPGTLADSKLASILTGAGAVATAAEDLGVTVEPGEGITVDVVLDDGTRIVGEVVDHLSGPSRGPARVGYSKFKPEHHLRAWLDLMALVAHDPEGSWRSVAAYRNANGTKAASRDLIPLGGDAPTRRRLALEALAVAVDLFRRSRCDVLPLFPKLSEPLYRSNAGSSLWSSNPHGRPDQDDTHVAVPYGHLDFEQVTHLPRRPDDPAVAGPAGSSGPGRAQLYAAYLWGAVERSSVERDSATADAEGRP